MSSSESQPPNERLVNGSTEKRRLYAFYRYFCITATLQGRISYFLMSFHVVNPGPFTRLCNYDPHKYLFANMIYGFSFMLYTRPSMATISTFHRIVFSICGSLMFNHSSMMVYDWLAIKLEDRPYSLVFASMFAGRMMLAHLLAYLYHVDTRTRSYRPRAYNEFEEIYRD